MADIFYTILIIWVLWRIFGGSVKTHVVHHHQYKQPDKKDGEIRISSYDKKDEKEKTRNEGEYVDYEEIK